MTESQLLLEAIEHIYQSSEPGSDIHTALAFCAELLGCDKALLVHVTTTTRATRLLGYTGLTPDESERLRASIPDPNNFLSFCNAWDQDNTYDAERLRDHDELTGTDFYAETLQPLNIFYTVAGVIERNKCSCTVLVAYRSFEQKPFAQKELKFLRQLLPHWRRALKIEERLADLASLSQAANAILDQAPFAILMIDGSANILYTNCCAERVLELGDGISAQRGALRISCSESRERVLNLFAALEHGQDPVDQHAYAALQRIERPSGMKPYQLMGFSLRSDSQTGGHSGLFAVFIYDPSNRLPIDTLALRNLEGLTEAEARLCESIYNTKSLNETAKQLDVSVSTAKTHLLNTFRKLGINSQAELMRYLAHMPKMPAENQRQSKH